MPDRDKNPSISRRQFVAGVATAGAMASIGFPNVAFAGAGTPNDLKSIVGPGLNEIAERNGLFFGSAIEGERMAKDPAYSTVVAHECGVATPEGALQWKALQPEPDRFYFDRMDGALDFARTHGMWLRGHSVLWHEAFPAWAVDAFRSPADWDRLVAPYIHIAAARYGPFLRHWDVLNEALDPDDGRPDGLRSWQVPEVMGEDYVVQTFRRAHEAAPHVALYYNDYDMEYDDRRGRERRRNMLRAFERWTKAGVPLGGFGMQGHLKTERGPVDQKSLRGFLADVAGFGLDIVVSELDVREHRADLSIAQRDGMVADDAARFLDAVLDEPRVRGVVTWGMSDKYSWLLRSTAGNRGLCYDDDMRPKPLRDAIAAALNGARERFI